MKKSLLTLAALALSQNLHADVLKLDPGTAVIENITISKGATATIEGRQTALTTVGAGLRRKKVAIIWAKVYVAQFLVADASKFDRAHAWESLDRESAVAIRLDFLRYVDAQKVQTSFNEALVANKVDLNGTDIKAFLEAVSGGGDAETGKALTIVGERLADGSEVITYENTKGQAKILHGKAGFVKNVFSIWLGLVSSDDPGLQDLQKELLSG